MPSTDSVDTKGHIEKPKVLIVEDESIVAEDIREKLEASGYSVVGVTDSGREAIELAKRNSPDLVMMDIHIKADLNGVESAICIQGLFEHTIPIVFVSGYSVDEFPEIGAVYPYTILNKPFSEEDLASSIVRIWPNSSSV
jgi:CheY-like chemotaxis protein